MDSVVESPDVVGEERKEINESSGSILDRIRKSREKRANEDTLAWVQKQYVDL